MDNSPPVRGIREVRQYDLEVPKGLSKAQLGIQHVDDKWGINTKVIFIAYHGAGRAVSVRSNERVITHMIACYRKGKTSADVRQMLMRAAGNTRQVTTLTRAFYT